MAGIPYSTPGEYWASGGARQHPIGCRCSDAGYCELARLKAEERAEAEEERS